MAKYPELTEAFNLLNIVLNAAVALIRGYVMLYAIEAVDDATALDDDTTGTDDLDEQVILVTDTDTSTG